MARVQLLVSVRNAEEAIAAADGGADIVDVKDPDQGSLGFAGWQTVQSIQQSVDTSCTLSAALGELREWQGQAASLSLADTNTDKLPILQFAKIGLAGQLSDAPATWIADWQAVRKRLPNVQQWVAVAYSDFGRSDAPAPERVLDAAIATGCQILLLDTFVKDGRTTFDHLSEADLKDLIQRSHDAAIKVAIAGQVSADNVGHIQTVKPDIVAVRGAVCEDRNRRKCVQQGEVTKLRKALDLLS